MFRYCCNDPMVGFTISIGLVVQGYCQINVTSEVVIPVQIAVSGKGKVVVTLLFPRRMGAGRECVG